MTLTSALTGAAAAFLADLTTLSCGFLFVTGAFDFTDTGFATVLDAFVVVAVALETTFLLTGFTGVLDAATVFLTEDFELEELLKLALAATGFAFFTESVRGFAGLFIAFAMESNTNWLH
ncbi:hypothetical protein [Collimonas sp.]|uniref:hypothetical protein n=1 Tax=Collimonas sp. TaxID=1963772 RepID=UPI002BD60D40|nr:hypothetical protein [Collimonas sp.]HWW08134.1 hypothetical protein [Collimonas sp.]